MPRIIKRLRFKYTCSHGIGLQRGQLLPPRGSHTKLAAHVIGARTEGSFVVDAELLMKKKSAGTLGIKSLTVQWYISNA